MAVSAPDLVAAPLGDSDRLETGDFVLALGSPFGLSHSVTFGIISARGRWDLHLPKGTIHFQDFLQTDAAINPGNSGGPLVNLHGELIGINNSIASDSGVNEGIGFAIPINLFMTVGRQLIATGRVARAFLGVNLNSKFGPAMAAELGLPRPIGAQVTGVTPNSPAEAAKLQPGDVILEFNGTPVEDDAHLVNLVSLTEVGKTVPVLDLPRPQADHRHGRSRRSQQVRAVSGCRASALAPCGRGLGLGLDETVDVRRPICRPIRPYPEASAGLRRRYRIYSTPSDSPSNPTSPPLSKPPSCRGPVAKPAA